jgi:hypothetical protein
MRMGQTFVLESSGDTHFPGLRKRTQMPAKVSERSATNSTRVRLPAWRVERHDRKIPTPIIRSRIGIRAWVESIGFNGE